MRVTICSYLEPACFHLVLYARLIVAVKIPQHYILSRLICEHIAPTPPVYMCMFPFPEENKGSHCLITSNHDSSFLSWKLWCRIVSDLDFYQNTISRFDTFWATLISFSFLQVHRNSSLCRVPVASCVPGVFAQHKGVDMCMNIHSHRRSVLILMLMLERAINTGAWWWKSRNHTLSWCIGMSLMWV